MKTNSTNLCSSVLICDRNCSRAFWTRAVRVRGTCFSLSGERSSPISRASLRRAIGHEADETPATATAGLFRGGPQPASGSRGLQGELRSPWQAKACPTSKPLMRSPASESDRRKSGFRSTAKSPPPRIVRRCDAPWFESWRHIRRMHGCIAAGPRRRNPA